LVALAAFSVLAACQPCPIIGSCESSLEFMTADGQIVTTADGRGIDAVKIDMQFIGGPGRLMTDTASTVTSDGGFWRISVPAIVPESVLVRFRIFAPNLTQPFSVYRWIVPTARAGEAYVAGRWVIDPYYPNTLRVYHRGRPDEIFPNIQLDFHQTYGPAIRGADGNNIVRTTTDPTAFAQFFLYSAFASDTGVVEGVVTAHLPEPYGDSQTILDLYPQIVYHAPPTFGDLAVGPSLSYSVAVVNKANGRPIPGVVVAFTRTGGISIDPSAFSVTTDANGRAVLPVAALAVGTVEGTVTLTPPAGSPATFSVSIPTFDADGTPLFATWTVDAVQ
jgi:hypothetical protein